MWATAIPACICVATALVLQRPVACAVRAGDVYRWACMMTRFLMGGCHPGAQAAGRTNAILKIHSSQQLTGNMCDSHPITGEIKGRALDLDSASTSG